MSIEIPNLSALSIRGIPFMLLTSYMITWNRFHQPSLEFVNQIELTYARTQGFGFSQVIFIKVMVQNT